MKPSRGGLSAAARLESQTQFLRLLLPLLGFVASSYAWSTHYCYSLLSSIIIRFRAGFALFFIESLASYAHSLSMPCVWWIIDDFLRAYYFYSIAYNGQFKSCSKKTQTETRRSNPQIIILRRYVWHGTGRGAVILCDRCHGYHPSMVIFMVIWWYPRVGKPKRYNSYHWPAKYPCTRAIPTGIYGSYHT